MILREGQDDFWLNIGLVFAHEDGTGLNTMLQAFPLDGKIVRREMTGGDQAEEPASSSRPKRSNANRGAPAAHPR